MFFKPKFDKTMDEVKSALETNEKLILLDVRGDDEFKEGHIQGAINLPLQKLDSITYPKDETLYVMCRSGQRSASACKFLKEKGYMNVYNVGGIIHWKYDVVK